MRIKISAGAERDIEDGFDFCHDIDPNLAIYFHVSNDQIRQTNPTLPKTQPKLSNKGLHEQRVALATENHNIRHVNSKNNSTWSLYHG